MLERFLNPLAAAGIFYIAVDTYTLFSPVDWERAAFIAAFMGGVGLVWTLECIRAWLEWYLARISS